jgi:hypothetical protein
MSHIEEKEKERNDGTESTHPAAGLGTFAPV